jgi:hypothetical protein
MAGRLVTTWAYGSRRFKRTTIERLAGGFDKGLRALIASCRPEVSS